MVWDICELEMSVNRTGVGESILARETSLDILCRNGFPFCKAARYRMQQGALSYEKASFLHIILAVSPSKSVPNNRDETHLPSTESNIPRDGMTNPDLAPFIGVFGSNVTGPLPFLAFPQPVWPFTELAFPFEPCQADKIMV
jgi:hypothetical protein